MSCPRCWHVIGEHLLCRNHGGEDGWTPKAYKQKAVPVDPCPPEAETDYSHEWWSWLDGISDPRITRTGVLKELVP